MSVDPTRTRLKAEWEALRNAHRAARWAGAPGDAEDIERAMARVEQALVEVEETTETAEREGLWRR